MPIVIKRPRARADLIDIWDSIAEDSENRADIFIDNIDRKFHILARKPAMGRIRGELAKDLRSFPVGRYIIFYFPLADGIEIVRVLHGARDIETIFYNEE